jgi:hypothetical protein
MAHFLLRFANLDEPAGALFASYDRFLALLNDPVKRSHLAAVTGAPEAGDPIYGEVRDLSNIFQDALTEIFMGSENNLTSLTKLYGVF